jgi:Tfp pilus assembly protein PilN
MSQSINLIPQEEIHEQNKTQAVKFSTVFSIVLLIVVGGISAMYFYRVVAMRLQIRSYDDKITKLRSDITGLSEIEITARNLDTRYNSLVAIYSAKLYYSDLLAEFKSRIPETIKITTFTMMPDYQISVSASGKDYLSISKFITDLTTDNELFTNVILRNVSMEGRSENISFFILITYNPTVLQRF